MLIGCHIVQFEFDSKVGHIPFHAIKSDDFTFIVWSCISSLMYDKDE